MCQNNYCIVFVIISQQVQSIWKNHLGVVPVLPNNYVQCLVYCTHRCGNTVYKVKAEAITLKIEFSHQLSVQLYPIPISLADPMRARNDQSYLKRCRFFERITQIRRYVWTGLVLIAPSRRELITNVKGKDPLSLRSVSVVCQSPITKVAKDLNTVYEMASKCKKVLG